MAALSPLNADSVLYFHHGGRLSHTFPSVSDDQNRRSILNILSKALHLLDDGADQCNGLKMRTKADASDDGKQNNRVNKSSCDVVDNL